MKYRESHRERANYGVDAPYIILTLAGGGLVCELLALSSTAMHWLNSQGIGLLATASVWLYGSKVGKLRLREQMMDRLPWNGSEMVLDVGCGSGLLLTAAAKRLQAGMAVGVDIWRRQDLANNQPETTLRNARVEGVADRVRVEEADVRQLPFKDATFDVVVSLNVLHNIAGREERKKALSEILRVLKPGGRLLLCDFRNTGEYVSVLREQGIGDACQKLIGWSAFFPMFAASGQKSLD